MEKIYNNEFDILVGPIWENEIRLFLSGKSIVNFIAEIQEKAQIIICRKGHPAFTSQKMHVNGSESDVNYYLRQLDIYKESLKHPEDKYALMFFFHKDDCFTYDSCKVPILKEDEDYNLWLILELRRYEKQIPKIDDLLNYQSELNFKNKATDFLHLLKLLLRQHLEIIPKKVSTTVEEWIVKAGKHENDLISKKKTESKSRIPSFKLKELLQNESYLALNINKVNSIVAELISGVFIDKKTKPHHFVELISGSEIPPEKRINWVGSIMDLCLFVNILVKKCLAHSNGKWKTTIACFTHKGNDLSEAQLLSPNGPKKNKEKLELILKKI